jgi:hypothetical protein
MLRIKQLGKSGDYGHRYCPIYFLWMSHGEGKLFSYCTFEAYIKEKCALLYSKNRMDNIGTEYAKYKS